MDDNKEKTVELKERWAVIGLPPYAVEVDLRVKVYEDGEVVDYGRKMNIEDIREAFRKAEDGYIDDDDVFVLTDKGRECAEQLLKKSEE